MKKLLISLTILFSVFIGVNSVNAEELKYDQTKPFEHLTMTNTIDLSDEEVTTLMKKANYSDELISRYLLRRNYALQNNKSGKYYFVNPGDVEDFSSDRIFINMDSENINQGWIEISNSRDGASTNIYYNIQISGTYTYYRFGSSTNVSSASSSWVASNNKLFQFTYNSNNVIYNGYNSMCLSYFYETNMKGQLSYKKGSFGGTSDIIVDDITYSINDTLPITLENGYHSLKEDKPKLTYKTGFVSSEAYSVLGKVSVDFSETDKNIYKYKISQFKLQFGSNDFSRENIPIYSHYKVFGKRNDTWTELSEEDLKIPYAQDSNGNTLYDDRRLITIDTTYDYSEGMLADASITLQINYSNLVDINTTDPIYTDWKIEFYFDNTNNGYIYVYDTLDSSKWTDTAKIFSDYIFYYFPPQYRYAFISSEENTSTGRIYFPSNSYMNEAVRLKGFYYHYNINWVGDELKRIISEDDQYYSYFDYKFSYDDKQCVVLSRKMAAAYQGYYDPDFLNNYMKLFPDEQIIINTEISYFYAPIGVKVTFAKNTSDTIIIHTPEGVIKNDSNTIYDSTDYDINFTYNNVDDLFSHLTNFFSESIPYMKPLVEIFNNFYKSLNEYIRAFIEFFCIFILVAAVVLWLNKRSEK